MSSLLHREACSRKTMQLVSDVFNRASIRVPDIPIIGKAFDDSQLRPPNLQIGERECISGDRCICSYMAKCKHGEDTDLAFVGTEFLLPDERAAFLSGTGLPPRRKKCLVCTRYFTTFIYFQARTDANFKVTSAPLAAQAFGNVVGVLPPVGTGSNADFTELGRSMTELPTNASIVHATDGYKPEAMLFVDDEFSSNSRAAREGALSAMMWRPVLRNASR